VLINADSGNGGVGATLSPDMGDGILSPDEPFTATFRIPVASSDPFTFFVNVRGKLSGVFEGTPPHADDGQSRRTHEMTKHTALLTVNRTSIGEVRAIGRAAAKTIKRFLMRFRSCGSSGSDHSAVWRASAPETEECFPSPLLSNLPSIDRGGMRLRAESSP
jgi:hypothetical protein